MTQGWHDQIALQKLFVNAEKKKLRREIKKYKKQKQIQRFVFAVQQNTKKLNGLKQSFI